MRGISLSPLLEELLERRGIRVRRKAPSRVLRQLNYSRPSFGRTQNSAQRRKTLLLEVPRRHSIRSDHEVFDQLGSAILPVRLEIFQRIAIEHGASLDSLERQRALLMAPGLHRLRDAILQAQIIVEAGYF